MARDQIPRAERVQVTKDSLVVQLKDGRTLTAPLTWYPRLLHGSQAERRNFRLLGSGEGVHWPELDEDISVDGLLRGLPSGESQASLDRWLAKRSRAKVKASGNGPALKSAAKTRRRKVSG